MTLDEAKQVFLSRGYVEVEGGTIYDPDKWREACRVISEWLEQQDPSSDIISRQAVIDQTYLWSKDEFLRVTNPFDYLRKRINSIPPVTPQPKAGHREYNDIYDHYLCGNCKTVVMDYDNFCPNCGEKMVDP